METITEEINFRTTAGEANIKLPNQEKWRPIFASNPQGKERFSTQLISNIEIDQTRFLKFFAFGGQQQQKNGRKWICSVWDEGIIGKIFFYEKKNGNGEPFTSHDIVIDKQLEIRMIKQFSESFKIEVSSEYADAQYDKSLSDITQRLAIAKKVPNSRYYRTLSSFSIIITLFLSYILNYFFVVNKYFIHEGIGEPVQLEIVDKE